MPTSWYIARDAKQHGPVTETEFAELVKHGHLLPSDYVWREGLSDWVPATSVLAQQLVAQPAVVPPERPLEEQIEISEAESARRWKTGPRIFGAVLVLLMALVVWTEPHSIPYRVGAALNGAFFGAIGGAFGAMLSFVIERFFHRTIPRNWKIGAASVGFLLGAGFGKLSDVGVDIGMGQVRDAAYQEFVRPKIDRAFVQRTLRNAGEAGRLYRLVEEKEPATFEAIVGVLVANLRSGATQDQVIALMREQFIERISKPRMGFLADDDLLEMFELTAEMAAALAQTNPGLCVAMIQGKPFGDLSPFLSADFARRERALMERMIATVPRQVALWSGEQLQGLNEKVLIELYRLHGDRVEVLDPAKQAPGREKPACLMFAEYMKGIFKLPRAEALALLRAMVLDPARLG